MFGFRLKAQRPPDPRRVTDGVVMRFDHVYEVDPDRMADLRRSRTSRPGTPSGSSPAAGTTSPGCTTTSPTKSSACQT